MHFIGMDWAHSFELQSAGRGVYSELKNICVWAKTNGGMGSLYRSHVWSYAGANTFSKSRDADLAAHPTLKPMALVADAIKDCSNRGGLILDPFSGSGTIILAAERTGRRAAAIELDPAYVDVAIRRSQAATGKKARHDDRSTFDEASA
jgi:DNA modification methylase